MDQDQRIDRLITYSFFSCQSVDLAEILRKAEQNECDPFHNLAKNSEIVKLSAIR